jgi:CDP-diacylglycerol--glycerol-3-phosphate 3-phosphatidyltransferase
MLRFPLLVLIVLLLYFGGMVGQLIDALLIVVLLLMDTLDGFIARRRQEQTLVGSALDVAADRAVEIVFWVTFTHLGLISVIVPLVVIIRGALTDSVRNIALQYGKSSHSMMRSRWARWLVASSLMRGIYGVVKAIAFTLLALALGLRSGGYAVWHTAWVAGLAFTWTSVALCILRGLPVIVEAPALFRSAEFHVGAPPVERE